MNNSLTVYKASAGSGKTFRLAVEYIKCLIYNPKAYENILAVTFTNKATEEMKMRILSTLYGLSRRLHSTQNYMDKICDEIDFSQCINAKKPTFDKEAFVSSQAREALNALLHNYSYFRVETIDRFFQTVLRNLARELDLTPNLRVELGAVEIEHQAVDELIETLRDNDKVMNWILEFIKSNMDESKSWNIIDQIKSFGEQLLKDEYKAVANNLGNTDADEPRQDPEDIYKNFKGKLLQLRKECDQTLNTMGQEIISALATDPLNLAYAKSGVGAFILKMANGKASDMPEAGSRVTKAANDDNGNDWVGKKGDPALRERALLYAKPKLQQALSEIPRLRNLARSCDLTISHIAELRLLNAIDKQIKKSNSENGRFLLSDTQTLLHGMIEDSDSPFIYEKIGSRLNKIMIDEFQDTSVVQWNNFKVLLDDCMSHGSGSLIVGDVKQSIYRWRSGDWRLLNNIKEEFPQAVDIKTLGDNYRSCPNLIRFNNAFFRVASGIVCQEESQYVSHEEADMLANAYRYSTLCQAIPEKDRSGDSSEGFVKVLSIDDSNEEQYTENTHEAVVKTIRTLLEKGVKPNKIAIIIRYNYNIPPLVDYCIKKIPGLHVVSDEAFRLDASKAVMIIIDAMRLIAFPEDTIAKARLIKNYQKHIVGTANDISQIILHNNLDDFLPKEFVHHFDSLSTLPLYQLSERLYSLFSLHMLNDESAYVATLFDCISEFISRQIATLPAWLSLWDDKICSKTIQSDSDDGLRIVTIHKSKGLEYDHVICPFMDWPMNKPNILWAAPAKEPFNKLKMIPLDYSSKLLDSIYDHDYRYEHLQNAVDDLNLLYVAFTRASRNLFIMTRATGTKKKDNRSVLINQTLESMMAEPSGNADGIDYEPLSLSKDCCNATMEAYTYGDTICVPERKDIGKADDQQEQNVFETQAERIAIDEVTTFNRQQEFRQSNDSVAFTTTDNEEQQRQTYIQLGNVLHYVFQNIRTIDDIDRAIFDLQKEGLLFGQDVTAQDVRDKVLRCLRNPQIRQWFEPGWTIYNECTILEPDGSSFIQHRPDRVIINDHETIVIDFKLAHPKPEYDDQVRRYIRLLTEMGHKNVHGYLLFMLPAKTKEVK